jgi:uncharacterized delta-60 repeat protein
VNGLLAAIAAFGAAAAAGDAATTRLCGNCASVLSGTRGDDMIQSSADAGFGNRGWRGIGGYPTQVVVRPDGRIVAATADGRLSQFLADGSRDRNFVWQKPDGLEQCPCGGLGWLALQTDGKAVQALNGIVARYAVRGRLDPSFGPGGTASVRPGAAAGVAVAADGTIVVGVVHGDRSALTRFLADGRPDASFGVNGRVPLAGGAVPSQVAVQPDGGILVASKRSGILRYLADGSLDPTFAAHGGAGIRTSITDAAIALAPEGRILVAGWWNSGTRIETLVVRLLADGGRDSSFGADGTVALHFPGYAGIPAGIVALPDGTVAIVGALHNTSSSLVVNWLALRIDADGIARAITARPPRYTAEPTADVRYDCWDERATAIAVQQDGKLLIAGDRCADGGWLSYLGRLTQDLQLDAGPPLKTTLTDVRVQARAHTKRVTATLHLSDAASVTVAITRAHGTDVKLLRGSALGKSSMRMPRSLRASFAAASRVRVVLVYDRARMSSAALSISVWASDARDRYAYVHVPLRNGSR